MGWIGRILTSAYRYVRYGKQIGKTAINGTKAYGRGVNRTAINSDGKIIRTIRGKRYDPVSKTQYTQVTDFYPNGTSRVADVGKNSDGIRDSWWSSIRYLDQNGYSGGYVSHQMSLGKPEFVNNQLDHHAKTFHSCIDSPHIGKDGIHTYNNRREINVNI